MSLQIYTNCSTLTVGCNLYTNSAKTIEAVNGFYSDGTFCYTVLNGAITNIASCTSTTTSTTTTSTTTIVVNPCRCYEVVFGSGGGEINYNDCDGETFNYVSIGASTYYQCVQVVGGLAQIFVISGDVTLDIVGNCLTEDCPPTTTTSTTTTSTTTTPACVINTTINVTETGWIRWTLCDGTVQDTFLSSLGTYTITQCIQYNSIRAAIPLAELADWDNVVWGSACTTTTTTSTTSTTTAAPAYNYYTLTSCTSGGIGTDYRSILSLGINSVYSFLEAPPARACYQVTDINAAPNTNDLPTLYGPYLSGCVDISCQQL